MEKIGKTPIDSIKVPNITFYLMKLKKQDMKMLLAVAYTLILYPENYSRKEQFLREWFMLKDTRDEVKDNFLKDKNGFFMDQL